MIDDMHTKAKENSLNTLMGMMDDHMVNKIPKVSISLSPEVAQELKAGLDSSLGNQDQEELTESPQEQSLEGNQGEMDEMNSPDSGNADFEALMIKKKKERMGM